MSAFSPASPALRPESAYCPYFGALGLTFLLLSLRSLLHPGVAIADARPTSARTHASESLTVVGQAPQSARSGAFFDVPFSFRYSGPDGNPVAGVDVSIQLISGTGQLVGARRTTDKHGIVTFDSLAIFGPTGEVTLAAVAAGVIAGPFKLTMLLGPPARIDILTQPSRRTVSDSFFARALRVRVVDNSGNRLEKVEVGVRLSEKVPLSLLTGGSPEPKHHCAEADAELFGPQVRRTGETGEVSFDSLGISGCRGGYAIEVYLPAPNGQVEAIATSKIVYDPDVALNRNYVAISAIKSIAGEIPDDEFFDIRFRFRLGNKWSVIATTDIALTARTTDSTRSKQKQLTEASLSLNRSLHLRADARNDIPERELFGGAVIKVFNTAPYAGVQVGTVELAGSPFQGSTLTVGGVWSLYSTPFIVRNKTFRPQRFNLLADFLIRSESIDFFKSLNIRGSVLLPAAHGQPLASRIGIAVPVGTLHIF